MLANMLAARFALLSVLVTISCAARREYPQHCAEAVVGDLEGVPYNLADLELAPYVRNWDIILPPNVCPNRRPYHTGTVMLVCEYDSTPFLDLFGLDNAYVHRTGSLRYEALVHTTVYCSDILITAEMKKKFKEEGYANTLIKGYYGKGYEPVPVAHEADSREAKSSRTY